MKEEAVGAQATGVEEVANAEDLDVEKLAARVEEMLKQPERIADLSQRESDEDVREDEEEADETGKEETVEKPVREKSEAEEGEEGESAQDKERVKLPDEVQESINRRIGKEVAKRKELEEQLQKAKEELARLQAQSDDLAQNAAQAPASFEQHPDVLKLREKISELKAIKAWCRKNEDGGEITGKEGKVYYDAEQVRSILENASEKLEELIAEEKVTLSMLRREHAAQEAEFTKKAHSLFPWLKDKTSEEYGHAMQILKMLPELRRLPHWQYALGVWVKGLHAIQQENQKERASADGSKPKSPPPPSVSKPVSAPSIQKPGRASGAEEARRRWIQSQSPEAFEEYLKHLIVSV